MRKKSLGNLGENMALSYLQKKGFRFLDRNFHSHFGEIDLIVSKNNKIVFVEVKTRKSDKYGQPEEAVNSYKLKRLVKTCQYFLLLRSWQQKPWQIDVVSLKEIPDGKNAGQYEVRHFENITL